jgi:hypothetical protein
MTEQLNKAESRQEANKTRDTEPNRPGLDLVSLSQQSAKPEEHKVPDDKLESIGVASIDSEGTLHLRLKSSGPGPAGEAYIMYKKTDKNYAEVIAHIGGIKPGEFKSVPPWKEQSEKK